MFEKYVYLSFLDRMVSEAPINVDDSKIKL